MLYVSEKTGKKFNTEKECLEADAAFDKAVAEEKARKEKLASERAVRAKEVEEALKTANKAYEDYREKLREFNKSYGPFHCSIEGSNPFSVFDFLMRF